MRVSLIRTIQTDLKNKGFYHGAVDGLRGPITDAAAADGLAGASARVPSGWQNWSSKRKFIGYIQLLATETGINAGAIDGWWGPQTEFASEALEHKIDTGNDLEPWRDQVPTNLNPNNWPKQTQSGMTNFYGRHGEPSGSYTPPLVRVECPWKLRIAWNLNQSTSKISIHEKCADSLGRILAKVHSIYGEREISALGLDLYGGSYMARKMRGGSAWSTHSWGIAIDWDPAHNKLNWNRTQATLDATVYNDWWQCWEEEGWLSLGRARNFDWMHIQAAKL